MAPLAALHIIRHPMAVKRLLTASIKLVLNLPSPKGWKYESSSRVSRSGVELGPLALKASVLPLDHLLSRHSGLRAFYQFDPCTLIYRTVAATAACKAT